MGRPDKREKQRRRAREQVDSALARGRAGEAADAVLRLAASERDAVLPVLRDAMHKELERAQASRDHAVMLSWVGRVEHEPRLLEASDEAALAMRFLLFTAALRARRWPQVKRLWNELSSNVGQTPIALALDAVVRSEGNPSAAELGAFVDADADRLGYDEARPRVTYARPVSAEQVEHACMACFGAEPFARFREVVSGWLAGAQQELGQALRTTAVLLAHRELLTRAKGDERAALEVAKFCASLAFEAGAPKELEATIMVSLRIVARALLSAVHDRSIADACGTVGEAALCYPVLVTLVESVVLGARVEAGSASRFMHLLQSVTEKAPSAALVLHVARIRHDAGDGHEHGPAPDWLVRAVERVLQAPATLATALDARDENPALLAHALFVGLPIPLAVRAVDESWPHASDPVRGVLCRAVSELVERMKEQGSARRAQAGLDLRQLRSMLEAMDPSAEDMSDEMLRAFSRSAEGRALSRELAWDTSLLEPLPESMRPHWQKLEAKVVAYDVSLLETALELETKPAARAALARQFWSRRPTLVARVQAIFETNQRELEQAEDLLREHLLDELVPGASDAGRAFELAEGAGAPHPLRRALSSALIEAVEREPAKATEPEVALVLRRARRLLGRDRNNAKKRSANRGKRKKRQPKNRIVQAEPAFEQGELQFGGKR
jgi:hypothetical protein